MFKQVIKQATQRDSMSMAWVARQGNGTLYIRMDERIKIVSVTAKIVISSIKYSNKINKNNRQE